MTKKLLTGIAIAALLCLPGGMRAAQAQEVDPDMGGLELMGMDKSTYLEKRNDYFMLRFSEASFDQIYNGRLAAIQELQQEARRQGPYISALSWTAIGPFPIPNGQTTTVSTPVSGRVTAIAVHPTNPNIVYVGTAQGGVWRSLNGGASWTPIFDSAISLAIGSLALAPSDPTILYVGTGEPNGSADSFFGVGLYRIDSADTAPILNGPFNPIPTTDVIGAKTFSGRAISKILVDPNDPALIFVSTASGIGGLGGEALGASPPITGLRGIYRCTNGTSASPAFAKLTVTTSSSIAPDVTGNLIVNDMAYDLSDAARNTIVCWVLGTTTALNGGIYRTTNAKAAVPTFVQTFVTTVSNVRGAFANTPAAPATMYVTTGETAAGTSCTTNSGCLRRTTNGGAAWSAKLTGGGGFCGGQCFYDLPVAVSPTDVNLVLIGGAGNGTCSRVFARSTNGASTFTAAGVADVGLHADAHAIEFAPSNANIVYEGNDGGIYKSTNGGVSFVSVNNAGFSATQFMSVDVHPTDPNFSIGGTQDNGTNWYRPGGNWRRADFGDGGYAVIDQNAADTTNVTMYHTYFNQTNAMGYSRVTTTANATDGSWQLFGCGFGGSTPNGMTCAASAILFYAPMERGPGSPNTLYFGSDVLYRSSNSGVTMTKVSQEPIVSARAISAIAIAPSNDNVRLVGLTNSQIWGTVTGSSTLVNMTGAGMPVKFIGRLAIDPANANIAYACFGGFGVPAGQHVWKTTNLLSGTPTWSASGNGLPDVPVNAMAISPLVGGEMFVGTDVGVYKSTDGGANWAPFTTGMPVVAVFDMKLQSANRILRVATHGRGMYERVLDAPVPVQLALVGAEIVAGHPRMTWSAGADSRTGLRLYRRTVPGDWAFLANLRADNDGQVVYEDLDTHAGRSYEYKIGVMERGKETMVGQVWVDVPVSLEMAIRPTSGNPSRGALSFNVKVPENGVVSLEVMDINGRRVSSHDYSFDAGDHQVSVDATGMASGVYWARLIQMGKMITTRVTLVN